MTENKTLEEEIDLSDAIIGIPLVEFVAIEEAVLKAKGLIERGVLAANPEKKQVAIEEALNVLAALFAVE